MSGLENPLKTPRVGGYDPLDVQIGKRMRELRLAQDMALETLAERVRIVTWQQMQRYESGQNRISASMMFRIAIILNIHPGDFFTGLVNPITNEKLPPVKLDNQRLLKQLDGLDPDVSAALGVLAVKIKKSTVPA